MNKMSAQQVIVEHAAFVWRVLIHLGVPRDRVEDLSQEVFLVVVRDLRSFEARSSVRTWLYGICRNMAAHARRDRRTRAEVPTADLPESIVQPAQEGEVWIKQAHGRLVEALQELDEDQRMTFLLYEVEELSMEEIADACQVAVSTCYSRLYAARQKVQSAMRRRALPLRTKTGGTR